MTDAPRPALRLSLPPGRLAEYVARQMAAFFPDGREPDDGFEAHVRTALDRLAHCLGNTIWHSRRAAGGEAPTFNHLHSDHYATFLALLANTVHRDGGSRWLAEKLFCLNKALHSLDIFFEVELPSVFQLVHTLGIVIGRATLSDYLMVYQGCTIGGNRRLDYPVLGRGIVMYGHSRVIGASRIGDNCIIGNGAVVVDTDIPPNSVVTGAGRDLAINPIRTDVLATYFGVTR